MAMRDGGPAAEDVRKQIQALRHEIEELCKPDQQQRLSRQSQAPWDTQKQHEAKLPAWITLGAAMGDFVATSTGIGFERGAPVFAGLIAIVAADQL